jgi:hypothetical protein
VLAPEVPYEGFWTPILVSVYHCSVIAVTVGIIASPYGKIAAEASSDWRIKLLLVAGMGAVGGALNASRRVIIAVRYRAYLRSRVLWQILTPVHSAVLACVGYLAIEGGLLSLANTGQRAEPRYTYFVMAFSFLVGFVSEVFVKRLIAAADALFGEVAPGDPEPSDGNSAAPDKQPRR